MFDEGKGRAHSSHKSMERPSDKVEIEKECFNFFSDAVFIHCEGKIVVANDKAINLMGFWDESEVIGRQISSVLVAHPDYAEAVKQRLQELAMGNCVPPMEQKLIKKDGSVLDVEIASIPHIYKGVSGTIVIIHNLTEKNDLEAKLKASQESAINRQKSYERVVELSPNAIIIHKGGKIVYANKGAERFLGIDDIRSIIGMEGSEFIKIHPDDREMVFALMQKLNESEMVQPFVELRLIRKDGTVISAEVSAASYLEDGERCITLIARDITARKRLEENKRKLDQAIEHDKLKTEFFSNLSHELKTPLNIILGSIQLVSTIRNESNGIIDGDKLDRYTLMMKQNCFRLLRLINNLIDITRLDVGFLKMNFRNNNIVEIIEDICMSVVGYVESKNLSITFDTEVEEIITACDADKLERVMLNLISNAIKFTPPGGNIYVNIYTKADSFVITVKDTGIGIPKDMTDKIFERFRQVEHLFTRNREGSGIGLSLVKSIIEAHGGTIHVESEEGMGSNFIMNLPVKVVETKNQQVCEKDLSKQNKVERINIEFSDIYG